MDNNFFDDIKTGIDPFDAIKKNIEGEKSLNELDKLIHKVFHQNDEGKWLLEKWSEAILISSIADTGLDMVDIGIREGMKRFIRGIILTIRRVEDGR